MTFSSLKILEGQKDKRAQEQTRHHGHGDNQRASHCGFFVSCPAQSVLMPARALSPPNHQASQCIRTASKRTQSELPMSKETALFGDYAIRVFQGNAGGQST
jgi:hypothetical protein